MENKDKSLPAHSIEYVEDLQRYIAKLEKQLEEYRNSNKHE